MKSSQPEKLLSFLLCGIKHHKEQALLISLLDTHWIVEYAGRTCSWDKWRLKRVKFTTHSVEKNHPIVLDTFEYLSDNEGMLTTYTSISAVLCEAIVRKTNGQNPKLFPALQLVEADIKIVNKGE